MNLIPTEKSGVNRSIKDLTILIYGPPGIGKSSTCAKFPNVFFLDFNSGLGGLDVLKSPVITKWEQVQQIYAELKQPKNKERIDWVVIDLVEEMYDIVLTYVSKKKDVEHPSDINDGKGDFGKTWKEITKEISMLIRSLAVLGYGRILISHVRDKDTPNDTSKYLRPNLSKSVCTTISSMSNITLLFQNERLKGKNSRGELMYKTVRRIRTIGTTKYAAKCQEVDGRILPDPIPLESGILIQELEKLVGGEGNDSC